MAKFKQILICDTTLRDGEQMHGVQFTPSQKLRLASAISDFGAQVIEIMPAVSPTEEKVATRLAREIQPHSQIRAVCRAIRADVEQAAACEVARALVFAPLSDLHLKRKLRISREENISRCAEAVDLARSHGLIVDLGGEDATRADIDYVAEFASAMRNKFELFLPADTIGCFDPFSTYDFYARLAAECKCALEAHIHNDFGMATANTLAAISAGATAFTGTFCGIGERAGNVAIEEVCLALRFRYGLDLPVKYGRITRLCRLVARYAQVPLHPNKPWVGANAFSHKSGIHAHGVTKDHHTYNYFSPSLIGTQNRLFFGKHSGRNSVRCVLRKHGCSASDEKIATFVRDLKSIAEKQNREFTEPELVRLYFEMSE